MSHEVGDQIGGYRVEATIGEGGMASVYQVRHLTLGSIHAIKVLHPHLARREDIRLRFLEEGKIQARLRHPNILPVTDLVNEPGVAGLVMEFLHGEDLGEWLDREGTAPIAATLDWVQQSLGALAFVHENNVVHRDLKPSNLFLSVDPRGQTTVRIMDFGIAKVREREQQLTNPDMGKMGTLRYMSPEQLDRPDQVDHRADLFAMGAILYEALVGRSPFDDDSDYHVMRRIAEGRYTAPGDAIPDQLIAIIGRALATVPGERFSSAEAFSAALEGVARAERYRRARRLLHAVESYGLPNHWWVPDDPGEAWLGKQERRLQDWLQTHGPPTAAAEPSAADGRERRMLGEHAIELVTLSGGKFVMGSAPDETGRHDDEGPPRPVSLAPLRVMTTPVTQAAWAAISDSNPSMFTDDAQRPVERVSWEGAIRFANRLSSQFGLKAAYFYEDGVVRWDRTADGFRLPTEAEWEYACRAGTRAPTWWDGDSAETVAWFADNADGQTQPVATKAANPWGLFDMNGNVYEWCWDRLGGYLPQEQGNPVGAQEGNLRVLRGGSFRSSEGDLRSAFRNGREPEFRHQSIGLRLVRGAPVSGQQ